MPTPLHQGITAIRRLPIPALLAAGTARAVESETLKLTLRLPGALVAMIHVHLLKLPKGTIQRTKKYHPDKRKKIISGQAIIHRKILFR
jgi:hypothetical protein